MTLENISIPYPDFMLGQFIDPDAFDLNNLVVAEAINKTINIINKILDSTANGDSGADQISMTPIAPFATTKLQTFLKDAHARLQSAAAGNSGADYVGASTIVGVAGNTVRSQLDSLKKLLDIEKGRIDALTTRMTTAETNINNRYTKAEVDSKDAALQTQITTNKTDIANRYTKSEVDSKDTVLQTQITTNKNDIAARYTKTEVDSKTSTLQSQINTDKTDISKLKTDMTSHTHDERYPSRDELAPYLQGGDTVIRIEAFTITNSNNGDGTFSYTNRHGVPRTGTLGDNGGQIFNLEEGQYLLGLNHVTAFINDTLKRSVASGGLSEPSVRSVMLTAPEGVGTEITVEYFQRLGVSGEHNIIYGSVLPPPTDSGTMWFKVVG